MSPEWLAGKKTLPVSIPRHSAGYEDPIEQIIMENNDNGISPAARNLARRFRVKETTKPTETPAPVRTPGPDRSGNGGAPSSLPREWNPLKDQKAGPSRQKRPRRGTESSGESEPTLGEESLQRMMADLGYPDEKIDPEVVRLLEMINRELITSLVEFAGQLTQKTGETWIHPHHMALHALRGWSLQVPGFTGRPVAPTSGLPAPIVGVGRNTPADRERLDQARDIHAADAHRTRAAKDAEPDETRE